MTCAISHLEANHVEEVVYQLTLYLLVELAVTGQTGTEVHLKQPRIKFFVYEYVKAEKLEAIRSPLNILCVSLPKHRLYAQKSFVDDVIDGT